MRILLLATSFNALTQRIYVELAERGHELSVELDVNDNSVTEAVRLFRPDLVIAPFLRRAIPEAVWRTVRCLIVHPGPAGDPARAGMEAGPAPAHGSRPRLLRARRRGDVADAAHRAPVSRA